MRFWMDNNENDNKKWWSCEGKIVFHCEILKRDKFE